MKSQKNDVTAGQEVNLAYYQIVSVFKEKSKRSVHPVFFYGIEFFFKIVYYLSLHIRSAIKFQNRRNKHENID